MAQLVEELKQLVALESLIETAGEYIDFLKLGWGTADVSTGVKAKVAMCQEARVNVCLGGTLLEIAMRQQRTDEYVRWMHCLGLEYTEVFSGALAMQAHQEQQMIHELSGEFRVISEVGLKDPMDAVIPSRWVAEMTADLNAAGASLFIAEGRESGTVGLFEPTGQVRADLAEAILHTLPEEASYSKRLGRISRLGSFVGSARAPI